MDVEVALDEHTNSLPLPRTSDHTSNILFSLLYVFVVVLPHNNCIHMFTVQPQHIKIDFDRISYNTAFLLS